MRVDSGRTKKLTVAFHFQSSRQAAWRCDECRRQGLEVKRRCGWLPLDRRGPRKVVWVRGVVGVEECPKSLVTPQSLEWIERFLAWKFAGGGRIEGLDAREADAFLMLEREWRTGNGEQQSGG